MHFWSTLPEFMSHAFEGSRAKLARAEELILQFNQDAATFLALPASALTEEPPPARLGALLGDIVHNLRSSLDHVVHQLIMEQTGKEPTYRTYEFPIFCHENQFDETLNRKLRDVSDEAVELIKDVQPFQSDPPKASPLHTLQDLSTIDRHSLLTLGVKSDATGTRSLVLINAGPLLIDTPIGTLLQQMLDITTEAIDHIDDGLEE